MGKLQEPLGKNAWKCLRKVIMYLEKERKSIVGITLERCRELTMRR